MRVVMNSDFFDCLHPFQYVWPTLVHAGIETVGSWAAPEGHNYKSLRMEYDLCEETGIEVFRVTDLTGKHVYIQDTRPLPCVAGGIKNVQTVMALLKMAWSIGDEESRERGMTQTALTQSHGWFRGWMNAWLLKQAALVKEQTAPSNHELCARLVQGI